MFQNQAHRREDAIQTEFFFFGCPSYIATIYEVLVGHRNCPHYIIHWREFSSLYSLWQPKISKWSRHGQMKLQAKILISQSEKGLRFFCGGVWYSVSWQYPTMAVWEIPALIEAAFKMDISRYSFSAAHFHFCPFSKPMSCLPWLCRYLVAADKSSFHFWQPECFCCLY